MPLARNGVRVCELLAAGIRTLDAGYSHEQPSVPRQIEKNAEGAPLRSKVARTAAQMAAFVKIVVGVPRRRSDVGRFDVLYQR